MLIVEQRSVHYINQTSFQPNGIIACGMGCMGSSKRSMFDQGLELKTKWDGLSSDPHNHHSFIGLLFNLGHISVEECVKMEDMFYSDDEEMRMLCKTMEDGIFKRIKQDYDR